jgi:hypothetical protein
MSEKSASPVLHTCKNCGNTFNGRFCNECGEKVYTEHDRSFKHIFEEGFHFLTHFEGNFFNTLKAILAKPGRLSLDFCNGIRKRYFKPLSFFLMLVIIYLLFPVFEGLNKDVKYHKQNNFYGTYATQEVSKVQSAKHFTDEEMREAYKHKGEKTSKFLLFITIPAMALMSYAMGFRKRKYYFDHFIFAVEPISFLILSGFLLAPFVLVILNYSGIKFYLKNDSLVPVIFLLLVGYTTIAARTFFKFKWWFSAVYALILSISLGLFIGFVYNPILFFIAIHLL